MIKDLMVHLDGSAGDAGRLAHAEALSAQFEQARITGLYTNALPEYAYVLGVQSEFADMGPVIELEQKLRQDGDRIVARLNERLNGPGTLNEVRRIDAWPSLIPDQATSQARCADLFLASTPYRENDYPTWGGLVETVLFESGSAVYLIPPACPVHSQMRTVLFAWKETVETARAVRQSLPFLQKATRVYLLAVNTNGDKDIVAQVSNLAAHLDRHGVSVEVDVVEGENARVGEIIRSEAAKTGADLIAMGAYGHSRLRELVLGGATRDLIERSDIPLLLTH